MAVQLHVKENFNYEEAAHAATDIVGNLEGLPGEVSFLLEEIREKDDRIGNLLQRINTRHYGMTKHPQRHLANPPAGSASATLPLPSGSTIQTDHLPHKEAQTIMKIQSEWDKIEALQDEKVKLAERMERIVLRARERARNEWIRVGGIDVDELDNGKGWESGMGSGEIILPPGGLGSGSDARPKKRRPQALPLPPLSTNIMHPPSSMPPPPAPSRPSLSARSSGTSYHPQNRSSSRADRHKSVSTVSDVDLDADVDVDAEGEIELGETDGDDTIYCTCQNKSYGEMIGCDNDNCEFEWFHIKCVGVTPPLPETWYCPDCIKKQGARERKTKKR